MHFKYSFGLAIVVLSAAALSAEPTSKIEKSQLPEVVAKALRPQFSTDGHTIRDGETELMTLWLPKEIPVKASVEQIKNGLTYREIPEGTLISVVRFEKAFVDYRKQQIAAGTYTLRIAVQPDTGDHRDTAPHGDFVLLTPAADDKTLEPPELKDLVKRSLKSTGGDHPGVMLLYPHFGKDAEAKVVAKGNGVHCLQVKCKAKTDAGETSLGVSIVVAGFSKMR